ncbi:Nuclear envelope morphology protein 1 [Neophaeococcomyces mojaviensis]|uniref:Nuclear envelope morphology protein 1 n=1 Tax=Neophaeococcomyces mojaviensis TaxID=3383035 RepID=A0ACC2ZUF0_9EURO|nr:Nuclear envelope morphology protein 1 [Knufia sp. JES_112]
MNSLNLLSAKVIGTATFTRPRSKSQGENLRRKLSEELSRGRAQSSDIVPQIVKQEEQEESPAGTPLLNPTEDGLETPTPEAEDEKQLLLREGKKDESSRWSRLHSIAKRIADALSAVLATIGMPIVYVARCFQDESGHYSLLVPFKKRRRKSTTSAAPTTKSLDLSEKPRHKVLDGTKLKHSYSSDSLNSMNSLTDSDSDRKRAKQRRSKKLQPPDEDGIHRRRSSRIRLLQNDEATKRQKKRSALADGSRAADNAPLTIDSIKSPMSQSSANKLRYPHAPQPPRPLIPRRQPSYNNVASLASTHSRRHSYAPQLQQKTLILDLDETLIHSIAKGGRMSSGHMVEVKLNVPVLNPVTQAGHGGQYAQPPMITPQHPILYYVHKRPHCDEFLRKIAKWYKVVIFTASVQEYADPVIDWLEQERKYFAGRYYRQHCTFRNGSYIKDLSSIEPDLSKVMILDNSPVSYAFHEDNAIPIEGWINDPTDNDLLHLIPLLEALQYVTDVRALLALRRGEADASTATSAAA